MALVFFSLLFYAWGEPVYVVLMLPVELYYRGLYPNLYLWQTNSGIILWQRRHMGHMGKGYLARRSIL